MVDSAWSQLPALLERRLSRFGVGLTVDDKRRLTSSLLPNSVVEVLVKDPDQIFCGQYSRDGTLFTTACQGGAIRVFHTTEPSFRPRNVVFADDVGWAILDAELSHDNRRLAYSSWSPFVNIARLSEEDEEVELDEDGGSDGANENREREGWFSVSGDEEMTSSWSTQRRRRLQLQRQQRRQSLVQSRWRLDFEPSDPHFCLFSIKWSADSSEIVGGSSDRCLHIYNLEQDRKVLRINGHHDDVNSVCFLNASSRVLLSASDDRLVKVWDRREMGDGDHSQYPPIGVFRGHTQGITHVSSKEDDRYILSNAKDQTIKLWDLRTLSSSLSASSPPALGGRDASQAMFEGRRRRILSRNSFDYRYQLCPPAGRPHPDDSSVRTFYGHVVLRTLIRAYFSPRYTTDQQYIVSGSACGSVFTYHIDTGKLVQKLSLHSKVVRDVSMDPFRPQLVSTSWDGRAIRLEHCREKQ